MKILSKIILSIVILIIALAIGHYFILFLPKENERKELLRNSEKCMVEASKLYEKEKKENPQAIDFIAEFKFNARLNTCFYKGSYVTIDHALV